MISSPEEKVNPWLKPLSLSGIIFLILGVTLMLTNPNRKKYEEFATQELILYLKENICQQTTSNLEQVLKSQMCNLMVDTGKKQIPVLVSNTTERHNYLLLSVYETRLYIYNFETIGIFNNFYIIAIDKAYDQE